ncbi:unnamed protein product [Diamesa hyperborea]
MKVFICAILTVLVKLSFGFENFEDSFMEMNLFLTQNGKSLEEVTEIIEEDTDYSLISIKNEQKSVNYSNNIDTNVFNESEILIPSARHLKQGKPNFFSVLFNRLRNMARSNRNVNSATVHNSTIEETNVGLDIDFESFTPESQQTPTNEGMKMIYFGTKWCGDGDVAKNKRDIGYFYLTDSCCRSHDLCPVAIDAQDTKFGLKNTGKFTRSHCDCDADFFKCLKRANTMVSKQIGMMYFNLLGPQCFREEYPVVKCNLKIRKRCLSYAIDESKSKQPQWFDNRWF